MTFPHIILLFVAAILGGTLNSVAGGGSFFAFPALLFTGVPPVQANATNTVALWPGSVASIARSCGRGAVNGWCIAAQPPSSAS